MLYGVKFGDYHSLRDWGLYLPEAVEILPPDPQTYMVNVPGRDGALDLTESLTGSVAYEDRTVTITMYSLAQRKTWPGIYHTLLQAVHGKQMQIVFDEDANYYYIGRCVVQKWTPKNSQTQLQLTVKATLQPFKWERQTAEYKANVRSNTSVSKGIPLTGRTASSSTNYWYGTAKAPLLDLTGITALEVSFGDIYKDYTSRRFQVSGSTESGELVYFEESRPAGYHAKRYSASTLTDAGLDLSRIYRINVQWSPDAVVKAWYGYYTPLTIETGVRTQGMTITCGSGIDKVWINNKVYELVEGSNDIEDVVLDAGEHELCFFGDATSDRIGSTVEVSFRRGWL